MDLGEVVRCGPAGAGHAVKAATLKVVPSRERTIGTTTVQDMQESILVKLDISSFKFWRDTMLRFEFQAFEWVLGSFACL